MKTMPQIVADGGWRGTRRDQIKVKACIALILAMVFGMVSILTIGTLLFYTCVPAVICLSVSVILFIREQPVEVESFSGRAGADPRKLYGSLPGSNMTTTQSNTEDGPSG